MLQTVKLSVKEGANYVHKQKGPCWPQGLLNEFNCYYILISTEITTF